MADLTDDKVALLAKGWRPDETYHGIGWADRMYDDLVAAARELQTLRAAKATDKERVRAVVEREICTALACSGALYASESTRVSDLASNVADAIASRAAEQLAATTTALPGRKEWDCDASDRGDPTDSSDYVDGWNDALDALELATGRTAPAPGCPVHYGSIHGGEAEELRNGIETIVAALPEHAKSFRSDLIALLDRVDARDSLAHIECLKLNAAEIAQLDHHIKSYQVVASTSCNLIGRLLAPHRSKT